MIAELVSKNQGPYGLRIAKNDDTLRYYAISAKIAAILDHLGSAMLGFHFYYCTPRKLPKFNGLQ